MFIATIVSGEEGVLLDIFYSWMFGFSTVSSSPYLTYI
jgi:hypothetical protein